MLKKMLKLANQGEDEDDHVPNVKPGCLKRTSSVRNATTLVVPDITINNNGAAAIKSNNSIATTSATTFNNIGNYESPRNEASVHLGLLDLPDELLTAIAMESGFWGSIALRGTCKQLFTLLDDKSSWHDYSRRRVVKVDTSSALQINDYNTSTTTSSSVFVQGPVDEIENTVTIETRLHSFDNLVFGTWRGSGCLHADASPLDAGFQKYQQQAHLLNNMMNQSNHLASKAEAVAMNNPAVFFEHKTFDERFDFLGGVQIRMNATGLATADFFDHRETLPCYLAYVDRLREAGKFLFCVNGEPSVDLLIQCYFFPPKVNYLPLYNEQHPAH
jgi:hypothetical protein